MSITDILKGMPPLYALAMVLFSLYYAVRGVMYYVRQFRTIKQQDLLQGQESLFLKSQDNLTESQRAILKTIESILATKISSSRTERVIIDYIQEVLFKVVVTVSSFMALFIAYRIFSSVKSVNDISTGTATLLIFLFIWGIIGVSGYLTHWITMGKIPR